MSVALALFYFSRVFECVEALPLDIGRRVVQSCDASNDSRTTSDIIWSCLVTIFSCTWVAFHPNIPAPYESSFGIGLRRLDCTGARDYVRNAAVVGSAETREETSRCEKGWTQIHGFFALMGGFMLIDGKNVATALDPNQLEVLERQGNIVFPEITTKEIEDKSKGDALSKGFVVIQT
ncbi:hypothetical protein BD410DRAFT_803347 [Rickenella mellea]|uniref:Uncharacterized protein n=1 Tax=Rickenella mellea TaxID=50990 RepID=A0A4Y7Q579_9AGAM|nr:hypothetical protein BD410DRAFT_803347 [Rickenella mellea]